MMAVAQVIHGTVFSVTHPPLYYECTHSKASAGEDNYSASADELIHRLIARAL